MPKQDTQTKTSETPVKHIKKIEAQPAKTAANGEIKTAAPALGGGCIPVGT
jgi:hypothetical protein